MSNTQEQKTQEQKTISLLLLKDGKENIATRNGNNAAWLCVCKKSPLPLLLSGRNHKPVICNKCNRKYTAELTYGKKGKKIPTIPTKIIEKDS